MLLSRIFFSSPKALRVSRWPKSGANFGPVSRSFLNGVMGHLEVGWNNPSYRPFIGVIPPFITGRGPACIIGPKRDMVFIATVSFVSICRYFCRYICLDYTSSPFWGNLGKCFHLAANNNEFTCTILCQYSRSDSFRPLHSNLLPKAVIRWICLSPKGEKFWPGRFNVVL